VDPVYSVPVAAVKINGARHRYLALVGSDLARQVGEHMRKFLPGKTCAIVTDTNVGPLFASRAKRSLNSAGFKPIIITIPAGEKSKTLKQAGAICEQMIAAGLDRQSFVIGLGGGVVGDISGFVAAIYHRGIPHVQIPTTLLAMVDSSIGGKTGVNHQEGKNLVGAFYQPRLVLIDVAVLQSLPRREFIAGLAEVIKYGVIEDPALFKLLEEKIGKLTSLDRALLTEVITRSCAIKAKVVEQDERENDYRAVLNFGHTVGHALEAATHYQKYLHGEAVGIGMAQAATISAQQGFCDQRSLERIRKLIKKAGLPLEIPREVSMQDLIQGMEVDKKSAGGKIKFVICTGIGKTRFHLLSPGEILTALGA